VKLYSERRHFFPDPRSTLADGLVMVGGSLSVERLLEAYSFGIFPWPQDDLPVLWFSPEWRGVLDFKDLHVSQSFLKLWRKKKFKITVNKSFETVIRSCRIQRRPGQLGTWITPEMERAYIDFHRAGYAHSVECWLDGMLVGGVYGVYVGGVFSGESMFYTVSNASKVALYALIEKLKSEGHSWMDIQMVSDGLKSWGGKYIHRDQFLQRLNQAKVSKRPI